MFLLIGILIEMIIFSNKGTVKLVIFLTLYDQPCQLSRETVQQVKCLWVALTSWILVLILILFNYVKVIQTLQCHDAMVQKIKFFIKDFFNKCDQIHRKQRIWSHLLKKHFMKNNFLCNVFCSLFDKICQEYTMFFQLYQLAFETVNINALHPINITS